MTVTILVPVYGVEKYIAECAHSLFQQTYKDIDYVFCDDCTPDRSIDILRDIIDEYPDRKPHVRIIKNEKNMGSGGTRKRLISEVKTNCFAFVDSDDLLEKDAIEQLVNKMQEANTDIVDGAFVYYEKNRRTNINIPNHDNIDTYRKKVQAGNLVRHQLWGRLYKASVLKEMPAWFFDGIDKAEDYCVTTRLAALTTRSWIDDVVYLYRFEGQTSFNKERAKRDAKSYLKATQIVYNFYKERNEFTIPVEIGILRAYRQCCHQDGMTPEMVDEIVGYKPERQLTRMLQYILRSQIIPTSLKDFIYKAIRSYAIR